MTKHIPFEFTQNLSGVIGPAWPWKNKTFKLIFLRRSFEQSSLVCLTFFAVPFWVYWNATFKCINRNHTLIVPSQKPKINSCHDIFCRRCLLTFSWFSGRKLVCLHLQSTHCTRVSCPVMTRSKSESPFLMFALRNVNATLFFDVVFL